MREIIREPPRTTRAGLRWIQLAKLPRVKPERKYWKQQGVIPTDSGHEPVEECREGSVGWIKVAPPKIGIDLYESLYGLDDVWDVLHVRPPDVYTGERIRGSATWNRMLLEGGMSRELG
ncbi:Hypothetical protein D9617_16g014320 [Elsinoe fawcettii]|nr:Hypothetical protein D9617_16g014320 [Elsinoe fawcettii]